MAKSIEEFSGGILDTGMCEHLIHSFKSVIVSVHTFMGFEQSEEWHTFLTGWIYANRNIETPLSIEQSSMLAEYIVYELELV